MRTAVLARSGRRLALALSFALAAASCIHSTPKPPARLTIRGWVTVTLTQAQCRRVAKAMVAPPKRAPVTLSSGRRILSRVWTEPLVLNAASWPDACVLVGSYDAPVPGLQTYTARVGDGPPQRRTWSDLRAVDGELDLTGPYGRSGLAPISDSRHVSPPAPAGPPP